MQEKVHHNLTFVKQVLYPRNTALSTGAYLRFELSARARSCRIALAKAWLGGLVAEAGSVSLMQEDVHVADILLKCRGETVRPWFLFSKSVPRLETDRRSAAESSGHAVRVQPADWPSFL